MKESPQTGLLYKGRYLRIHNYSPHPESAHILRNKRDVILEEFVKQSREVLPAAFDHSNFALKDSLPDLLQDMADCLEGKIKPDNRRIFIDAKNHGVQRANFQDFTLDQVLHEYAILRRVLFHYFDEIGSLDRESSEIILDCLQEGIEEAGREFLNQSQQIIQAKEQQFKDTFEKASIGMAQVGLDGRWLRVNPKLCEMVGYSEQELLQKKISDITYREDLQIELNFVDQLIKGEITDYSVEKRCIHKNGSVVWVNLSVGISRFPDGQPNYLIISIQDITERKRLSIERERLYSLPNHLLCVLDEKGRFKSVNTGFKNVLGYSEEEMIGRPIWDFIHPDDVSKTAEVEQRGHTTVITEFVNRYRAKNGSYRWLKWTGTIIDGINYGAAIDITDLQLAEIKYSMMFNLAPFAFSLVKIPEGILVDVNSSWTRIIGFKKEEVIGKSTADLNVYRNPEHRKQIYQQAVLTGKVRNFETEINNPVTGIRNVSISMDLVDLNGVKYGITATDDITEEVAATNQLKQSQERLKLATEATKVGVWEWFAGTPTINCNQQCLELHGFSADEKPTIDEFIDRVHPEDKEKSRKILMEAAQRREPYTSEHRIVWPDKSVHWVLAKGQTIFNEKNESVRVIGTVTDISERKRQEEKLEKTNTELDRFAAIAAHDLKSPLNSITQFSELLAEQYAGQLGPDAEEYLDFIINAGNRMRVLIDSLLDYARLGSLRKDFKSVSMEEVLMTVRKNLKSQIDETGARITSSTDLPDIFASEVQITQLLQNLIANAIKFHKPMESPQVHVDAISEGDYWLFRVSDQGIGMENKYADKVFEIFRRAHGSSKYEGAGIGLAICKRIIENHGGEIWLESEVGKGTTFFFTLKKS
jgi:PAS domain S-box-containing protein